MIGAQVAQRHPIEWCKLRGEGCIPSMRWVDGGHEVQVGAILPASCSSALQTVRYMICDRVDCSCCVWVIILEEEKISKIDSFSM